MSVLIGINKRTETEDERSRIKLLAQQLIDAGYKREVVISDDCIILHSFVHEPVETLPAYEVDRIVKELRYN